MSSYDGGDFFGTDDVTFGEWWTWVQQAVGAISQASTRIGLGIVSAGFAIASSMLFNSQTGSQYGKVTLGASAVFAAWFAVSAVISSVRGR